MIKKIKVGDKEIEVEFIKGAVQVVFRPCLEDSNLQWAVDLMLDDGSAYWSYINAICPNKYMADKIASLFADENIEELFDKLRERAIVTETGRIESVK